MVTEPNTVDVDLTQTWFGGVGDWSIASNWTVTSGSPVTPVAGDILNIASGTAVMNGAEAPGYGLFDGFTIDLGAADATAPGVLQLATASVGPNSVIEVLGVGSIEAVGQSEINAYVVDNGTLTLGSEAGSGEPGALTVLNYAEIDFIDATLIVNGTLVANGNLYGNPGYGAAGALVNNGNISLIGGALSAGTVLGTGTIDLGFGGSALMSGGANQTIAFLGPAGTLTLQDTTPAPGAITGFQPGDFLVLPNVTFTDASYDAADDTLTLSNSGSTAAVINSFTAMPGTLVVNTDTITYATAPDPTALGLAVLAKAVGANTVVSTMTLPHSGTPITGAGVKVGIISDSFNVGNAAGLAAEAGYIPNDDGTSTVQVLSDATSGADGTGLAMAEDIYAVAPGASIAFAAVGAYSGSPDASFAQAVQALQAAGCNIIVDDVGITDTPVFQTVGTIDQAVSAAIASGIDYFSASGDTGNNFLDTAFTSQTVTLANGLTAPSEIFDNGTPYEPIQNADGATWYLEWNTPFETAAPALQMELFDGTGSLVSISTQGTYFTSATSGIPIQQEAIVVPSGGPYYIAVTQIGSVAPTQFELFNPLQAAQGEAGELLDPEAGGSGSELFGQDIVPGVNAVGAVYWGNTPAFSQAGDFPEFFSVGGTSTLYFDANNNPLDPPLAGASVNFIAPDGATNSLSPDSGLDPLFGTSGAAPVAAAVAALMLQANPDLTTAQVTAILQATATPLTNTPEFEQGAGLIQAPGAVQAALDACFVAGTLILTETGERPVEALAVGDRVVTRSGAARPICWIGVGRVLATRGRRTAATPVIVRKGALAGNVPNRDLRITKGHALWIDDVLIPVGFLVNHRSIQWDDHAQEVEIYHIELATHDVLLANGAPAETYRDDGNRWLFRNANSGWCQPPKSPCAPVLTGGPIVDAVWRRLVERAGPRPGLPVTDDPDLHLLVDGRRVDATSRHGEAYIFPLSARPLSVRVTSRSGTPAELGLVRDVRELGVAVRRIALRQATRFRLLQAADARLTDGFYDYETDNDFRWTNGDALVPEELFVGFSGRMQLVLHVGCLAQYLDFGTAARVA